MGVGCRIVVPELGTKKRLAKGVTPGTPIQLTNKILETYTHTHAPNKSAIVGNCAISNAIVFAIMRLCACVCVSQRVLRMALKRTNG